MNVAGKIFFAAISVLYPIIVFCGLEFWGLSPRRLSILLLALAFYQFLNFTRAKNGDALARANKMKSAALVCLMLICGGIAFFADNILFLKFYPVLVNLSLLAFFGFTLWRRPSFVFRMACLGDKTLKNSPSKNFVERYCNRVTFAWCIFFVCNACAAAATVFIGSDKVWSLYNGLISYILIGVFFAVEFLIRKIMQSKLQSYIPVCELEADSRPEGMVVSFGGDTVKNWNDFVHDVSKVRLFLEARKNCPWILHCEDSYFFMVALLAMLQSGRKALVTANRQVAFIKEIKKPEYGFITDEAFEGAFVIQDILKAETAEVRFGKFDKSKAEMVMYTSGTTGEPKAVYKKFLQFENELFELVKVFGDSWIDRKVYSTVNHHHIYGLLFTVLLPTATGLSYRNRRIDYPSELAGLVNEKAVIASSPAYLKRLAADSDTPFDFKVKPIIYSSGGPLPEEVARKACELTGFWTMEIYGSTETGGIAYRQSKNGPIWTPFEVCRMSLAENECLNIKSSYILEPEGFTTGDLADIYDDGKFLLKGRADSIVKIEEKRISLPEVESRLKQTGLVQDVRVVPMVGKRQYLAAAIVLNAEGRKKFADSTKLEINNTFKLHLLKFIENTVSPKKWRYLEELPQNTEGKIKMRDIQALFEIAESPNFQILKMRRETGAFTVKLKFPATSDFYDGHFPTFKLLPAVVQVDMVVKLAHALLEVPKNLQKIQRTKFASPIFPDVPVNLSVTYNTERCKLSFAYTDDAGKSLSSGTLTLNMD